MGNQNCPTFVHSTWFELQLTFLTTFFSMCLLSCHFMNRLKNWRKIWTTKSVSYMYFDLVIDLMSTAKVPPLSGMSLRYRTLILLWISKGSPVGAISSKPLFSERRHPCELLGKDSISCEFMAATIDNSFTDTTNVNSMPMDLLYLTKHMAWQNWRLTCMQGICFLLCRIQWTTL